jgi:putative cardiolipin synthase
VGARRHEPKADRHRRVRAILTSQQRVFRLACHSLGCILAAYLAACATLPPGHDYPKTPSTALATPEQTKVGQEFATEALAHGGQAGYHIISVGVDGFLMRLEMINSAERTLDLQYYILHGDESGRLLTEALTRAADRGVRIRLLLDDGETVAGDQQIFAIGGHQNIEIRVFNPFAYRGHNPLFKGTEYVLNHRRLDYRMHNKLLVTDNSIALMGGRNIGDQYFQIDPESQFADDDVFVGGPIVHDLSGTFDEFWNSALSIPIQALHKTKVHAPRGKAHADKVEKAGFNYQAKLDSGEPLAGMIAGREPLIWANARVICDSPEKKQGGQVPGAGSLLYEPIAHAVAQVQSELLLVSPYIVPSQDELHVLKDRLADKVRVRVLTNSLESAPELSAHSGYMHYRIELLKDGVQLYEVRSRIGNTRGSGQSANISRYGNYALHAKLFVLDRRRLIVGSMNLDQRSRRLNTEVGLIIDSEQLAQQMATRFDAMTRPENSYAVVFAPGHDNSTHLVWRTVENGTAIDYRKEPAKHAWQRGAVDLLSLLPLDSEL